MVSDFGAQTLMPIQISSLNPCCNGIWSQTIAKAERKARKIVLILVVMEYGLRLWYKQNVVTTPTPVLILVVMEYGLRPVGHI